MTKQTKLSDIEKHILSAVQSGTPITDAFKPMIKRIMEAALEAEMELHMEAIDTANTNRRNGKSSKNIKTSHGEFILETPRDRDGSFEPQLVKKSDTHSHRRFRPKNPIPIRLWYELFRYSE